MSIELDELIELQQKLIGFINTHHLEDFSKLYCEKIDSLKEYDHVEFLLRAIRYGLLSFVQTLLKHGSTKINANCHHSSRGISPLIAAIRAQKHDIIKYLIEEAKVNVNYSCETNRTTCLHEAIRQHDLSTISLLLQYGATIDQHHFKVAIIACLTSQETVSTFSHLLPYSLLILSFIIEKYSIGSV